jgi:hypothetical protein
MHASVETNVTAYQLNFISQFFLGLFKKKMLC